MEAKGSKSVLTWAALCLLREDLTFSGGENWEVTTVLVCQKKWPVIHPAPQFYLQAKCFPAPCAQKTDLPTYCVKTGVKPPQNYVFILFYPMTNRTILQTCSWPLPSISWGFSETPLGTLRDQLGESEHPLSSWAVRDQETVRDNPSDLAIKDWDQLSLWCIRSIGQRCLRWRWCMAALMPGGGSLTHLSLEGPGTPHTGKSASWQLLGYLHTESCGFRVLLYKW